MNGRNASIPCLRLCAQGRRIDANTVGTGVVGGFAGHSARSTARGGRSGDLPADVRPIPDTAWIPPWEIPLNSKYILAAVAGGGRHGPANRGSDSRTCAARRRFSRTPLIRGRRAGDRSQSRSSMAARLKFSTGGETWRGGQLAQNVFDTAVAVACLSAHGTGVVAVVDGGQAR